MALTSKSFSRRLEFLVPCLHAFALVFLNAWVCRRAFYTESTGHFNSVHGLWLALARIRGLDFYRPDWWPYSGAGQPAGFIYAPLIPFLTALLSHISGISLPLAFHILSGAVYCLGPLTLYIFFWRAGIPGAGFAAGLIYSFLSPSQWLVPDAQFQWAGGLAARRMMLIFDWDDLPHLTAFALMPLAAWFLSRALERGRFRDYIWSGITMTVMTLASMFGLTLSAIIAVTVSLAVVPFYKPWRVLTAALLRSAAVAVCAWIFVSPWAPPSLIAAIRADSVYGETDRPIHPFGALVIVALCTAVVWILVWRRPLSWPARWTALFACPAILIPVIAQYAGMRFVPQPGRYKLEMEFAIAAIVALCVRPLALRMAPWLRVLLLIPLLIGVRHQIHSYRAAGRSFTQAVDVKSSIEYRSAEWLARNLPSVRVAPVGSISMWLNYFTDAPQVFGEGYSLAFNGTVELASYAVRQGVVDAGKDAEYSLLWLKALGAHAVVVPGPRSPEFWRPLLHPGKFEGVLPVLWREDDTTIYRIPQRSESLAHVLRPGDLVQAPPYNSLDVEQIRRFVAALDNPSAAQASFKWVGANKARIRARIDPGQIIAVQTNWSPGWHARLGGRELKTWHELKTWKDGLGLMAIQPDCAGDCEISLDFDGGAEARITRVASAFVPFAVAGFALFRRKRLATVGG